MPDDQGIPTEQEIEDNKDWELREEDTTEYWFMAVTPYSNNQDDDEES